MIKTGAGMGVERDNKDDVIYGKKTVGMTQGE